MSVGTIAGIAVGSTLGALLLALILYFGLYRRNREAGPFILPKAYEDEYNHLGRG